MDRCEIFQPEILSAVGAIPHTGFLHTRLRSSPSPNHELQVRIQYYAGTLIRPTRTSGPIPSIPAPAKTHHTRRTTPDAPPRLQRPKSGAVPAALQRMRFISPAPARRIPPGPYGVPARSSPAAKMAGGAG